MTSLACSMFAFTAFLSDDMGTLVGEGDTLFYSFFNADQIFDFLLSIGMKPFVELSFMPSVLSSGDQTVFHYRANVTPPKGLCAMGRLDQKAGEPLGGPLRVGRSAAMVLRGLERAEPDGIRQRQAERLFRALPLHRGSDQRRRQDAQGRRPGHGGKCLDRRFSDVLQSATTYRRILSARTTIPRTRSASRATTP